MSKVGNTPIPGGLNFKSPNSSENVHVTCILMLHLQNMSIRPWKCNERKSIASLEISAEFMEGVYQNWGNNSIVYIRKNDRSAF
jgi:hypothetical protein